MGKSTLSFREDEADKAPSSKRFGFVQTLDTKPKRRLYSVRDGGSVSKVEMD